MEEKTRTRFGTLICKLIFMIIIFGMFGLNFWSLYKIYKLENQIQEVKEKCALQMDLTDNYSGNQEDFNIGTIATSVNGRITRDKRDATDIDTNFNNDEQQSSDGYTLTLCPEKRAHGRVKLPPAIHFHGDTSKYTYGVHENYNGNGHLHHPDKLIVDWIEHEWVETLGMNKHFSLDEGRLKVTNAGLYFIYAQIYYIDAHDVTGFSVKRNGRPILQCARDTKSMIAVNKTNTCFTAGAEHLLKDDVITIEENFHERYSVFKPGKSFFGVIKLGDTQ